MLYFNEFSDVTYRFGDEVDPTVFQDISIFAEVVDQVKNAAAMLGMPKEEIGPQFYDKLKENVRKMIKELPE